MFQVMVYLGDVNANMAQRGLTIYYRIADKIIPTEPPTFDDISATPDYTGIFTGEEYTFTHFFTGGPDDITTSAPLPAGELNFEVDPPVEMEHCSVYPMGVLHNFQGETGEVHHLLRKIIIISLIFSYLN